VASFLKNEQQDMTRVPDDLEFMEVPNVPVGSSEQLELAVSQAATSKPTATTDNIEKSVLQLKPSLDHETARQQLENMVSSVSIANMSS
jgi:hypothetical protein